MAKTYTIFDPSTGRIQCRYICPEYVIDDRIANTFAGMDYLEGESNDLTEFVETTTRSLAPRPTMSASLDKAQILADGVEVVTLSGLPDPCTVSLTDPERKTVSVEVAGGSETITTDLVGKHTVRVEAFPYLDWEGTFDGY